MRQNLCVFLLWASASFAQTYPVPQSTSVNDFADLLTPPQEVRLSDQLAILRREIGVEMSVVTLDSKAPFGAGRSLEAFATGLFNDWGIGDKSKNDGVLFLLLRDDKQVRIELGRGYGRAWDDEAQGVISSTIIRPFRNQDYPNAILNGTTAIIDEIVKPFYASRDKETGDPPLTWVFGTVAGLGMLFFLFSRRLRSWARKCPNCGQRGVQKEKVVMKGATRRKTGQGVERLQCAHCNYRSETPYIIPIVTGSDYGDGGSGDGFGDGFGGGSSDGGGASGD